MVCLQEWVAAWAVAWAAWIIKPAGYSLIKQSTTAGLERARLFCVRIQLQWPHTNGTKGHKELERVAKATRMAITSPRDRQGLVVDPPPFCFE